jgi:7-cyano-7-deazaguanine synthase
MRVLLLSGGIDSAALALWQRPDICLTIDYGHPAFRGELRAAKIFSHEINANHEVRELRIYSSPPRRDGLWPFRNQFLISSAAAIFGNAEEVEILIGTLSTDIYTDCTKAFIDSINRTFEVQKCSVKVSAPAINLTAKELLFQSKLPKDILGSTYSCHKSDIPCGHCPGCDKQKAFRDSLAIAF